MKPRSAVLWKSFTIIPCLMLHGAESPARAVMAHTRLAAFGAHDRGEISSGSSLGSLDGPKEAPSVSFLDISPAKAGGDEEWLSGSSLGSLEGLKEAPSVPRSSGHLPQQAEGERPSLRGRRGKLQESTWLVRFLAWVRAEWDGFGFPLCLVPRHLPRQGAGEK
jgi:hypothetical protein